MRVAYITPVSNILLIFLIEHPGHNTTYNKSAISVLLFRMSAKQRLQALSQQLTEGIPDAGTFEDIPRIRQVAPDSVGPYAFIHLSALIKSNDI